MAHPVDDGRLYPPLAIEIEKAANSAHASSSALRHRIDVIIVAIPLYECRQPLFDRRARPEASVSREFRNIGMSGDDISGLLWQKFLIADRPRHSSSISMKRISSTGDCCRYCR